MWIALQLSVVLLMWETWNLAGINRKLNIISWAGSNCAAGLIWPVGLEFDICGLYTTNTKQYYLSHECKCWCLVSDKHGWYDTEVRLRAVTWGLSLELKQKLVQRLSVLVSMWTHVCLCVKRTCFSVLTGTCMSTLFECTEIVRGIALTYRTWQNI